MHDTILVPTDGSNVAEAGVRTGVAMAKRFDAELQAVHVGELGELPPDVEDEGSGDLARRGREALERAVRIGEEEGVAVEGEFLEREEPVSVPEAILAHGEEVGADLVVQGSRGRTGLDRFLLGSVAESVLRKATVPVVTVDERPLDPELALERVVVATDGSDPARAAAEYGIRLAAATGAELHAVHVVDLAAVTGDVGTVAVREALEESGEAMLDEVRDLAEESDLRSVQANVLEGSPSRAIVDYAADRDADCIVMGTSGRRGLERILLGSVAERTIRLSELPVITTRG